MGIISDAVQKSDEAIDWARGASSDPISAEGRQDAARHTDWMSGTAAMLEDRANKTMSTDKIREKFGDKTADFFEYIGRSIGGAGAMTLGLGVEAIGLGKAGVDAAGQAAKGEFSKAGGIIKDAVESSAMDVHNNLAGAYSFSQIKDPEARRAAIVKASENAELQPDAKTIGLDDALIGTLRRRR